jgi:hypothetical protein
MAQELNNNSLCTLSIVNSNFPAEIWESADVSEEHIASIFKVEE